MIVTIHQPQYLPWLGYFDKIRQADIFVLLDNVQFKKNEWQNRNRIRTAQGWQWVTVPVLHQFGTKINEMKINNTQAWAHKHLKALEFNYAKAPYYGDYFPLFQEALNRPWDNLGALNIYLVRALLGVLSIKTRVVLASDYEVEDHKTRRLVDLCLELGARTYLSGQGGMAYLDEAEFKKNNIDIMVQDYAHPVYNQQWTPAGDGFISHLSIVDLLFNCGDKSLSVLAGQDRGKIRV